MDISDIKKSIRFSKFYRFVANVKVFDSYEKNVFKNNRVKLVALLWGAKNNTHTDNEVVNSGKILVEENLKLKLMY